MAGKEPNQTFPDRLGRLAWQAWLIGRVHADAFQSDPAAYLQAVMWRLRGLKVRSRNRVAPLAGRSPHAYRLWTVRQQQAGSLSLRQMSSASEIVPVIDCRSGHGIEETLASIARAGFTGPPITIGGPSRPGVLNIDRPAQLIEVLPAAASWICPMLQGDQLAPTALDGYGRAIASASSSRLIYADDDLITPDGVREQPHFKPQWNPDLFANHDFVTGACVVQVTADAISRLTEKDWARALVSDALASGSSPHHLPMMLHHRRSRPAPCIPANPLGQIEAAPTVSAVIPTRNHGQLLRKCVEGIEQADYRAAEIVIVDNGSDDPDTLNYLRLLEAEGHKVLRRPGPFNYSALNNEAVRHASGSMLCFLNNDVEMINRNWLSMLVRQAVRPDIGAAGAMLLYPDRTIQHAGVYLGIGGGAGHAHRFLGENDTGYFERARLPQLVSAVTAACLVVDREKFEKVEGFDEKLFPVAFNDVDLCLKLNCRGWQSFYEPRAKLIHHESKSRGSDTAKCNRERFTKELAALKAKWHTDQLRDPFHHPELSPYSEQFVVAV